MTSPAVQEHCPECNATEGRPCVDLEGRVMSGVHARRVWLFESLEAAEAASGCERGRDMSDDNEGEER